MEDPRDSGEARPITQVLSRLANGEQSAADELLPLVYEHLRSLARARVGSADQTMQATALVHEAWVRLGAREAVTWESRGHFYGAAARAMRHILVEQARRRRSIKRGGERRAEEFEPDVAAPDEAVGLDLEALDLALTRFQEVHPRPARLVTLRYFGGLEMAEIAEVLGISLRTAERDWTFARTWLRRALVVDPHT